MSLILLLQNSGGPWYSDLSNDKDVVGSVTGTSFFFLSVGKFHSKAFAVSAFIVAVGGGIITLGSADWCKSSLIRNNKSVTSGFKTKFLLRRW